MGQRVLGELLRGHGAHTDSVECFRGLTPELVGRRMDAFPYTLWQVLGHLNYWMRYELERIAGRQPAYPRRAALSWPEEPGPGDLAQWEAELALFERQLGELSELARAAPERLAQPVQSAHASEDTHDASLHGVLWQTVVHNSYHLGQVALMRRALGAWPPPAGGDTW